MSERWTPEEIRAALLEELTRCTNLSCQYLDWWARDKGITTYEMFGILAASPDFVYREWTEGQGDWVWTLATPDHPHNEREPEITEDGRVVYASGAQRSSDAEKYRYDLISPIGMRRLAETYAEGARKYGAGNWLKGFKMSSLLNHVQKHLNEWNGGDTTEDHLAHACWGLMALMHFDETRRDLDDRQFPSQTTDE